MIVPQRKVMTPALTASGQCLLTATSHPGFSCPDHSTGQSVPKGTVAPATISPHEDLNLQHSESEYKCISTLIPLVLRIPETPYE